MFFPSGILKVTKALFFILKSEEFLEITNGIYISLIEFLSWNNISNKQLNGIW